MFSSSSNIQINGGNFYDVARDMNVLNIQTPGHDESVLGVGSAQDEASGHRLMGIESGARMLPYDVSHRPHILSSSFTDARNPIRVDYPHLQPGVDLQLPQIDPLRGHESRDAHSRLVEPHPGLNNSSAIGYYPDWETTSRGSEFNHPSLSATVSLVPNPQPSFPSQLNWSGDPLRRPRPTNIHPVSSTNSGQGPSTSGQLPRLPAAEPPSRSLAQLHNSSFPWDRPLHEPKTSINGGTFISGNVNRYGETGLHILYSAIAGDAFHDSAERYPQPQCHPDTRKKLLDVLHKWACGTDPPRNWTSEDINYYLPSGNKDSSDGDNKSKSEPEDSDDEGATLDWESVVGDDEDPKLDGDSESESEDGNDDMDSFIVDKPSSGIVWLHGPAGSGKSAVAQSFCQRLKAEGRLGGGFFFKRGHLSRGTASKLLSTIAYQLALIHPELNQAISQTVENDPAIVHRSFFNQLRNLIIEPCRRTPLTHPVVIVIDGLDECEGQNIQQEILRAMATAMRQQPQPILFFIASRPEPHISEVFNEPILDGFHCALDIKQSFEDVRKYLLGEFGRIHREHRTMATVSRPWPSSEVMDNLVNKSSGYFIYASTIIKYIDDKNFRPKNRLEIILGIKERGLASPFDTLDQLYVHILSEVPLESRSQLLQILTILGSRVHPTFMSVSEVEQLLELHPGDLRLVLRNLHSVIKVPEASDSFRDITVHHASFLDFLNDPTRSGPFYLRGSQHCMDLLRCILNALGYEYSPTSIGCTAW
ncbi:hypothetical protein B0H11DRAFT_2249825 [Mycena galericulata]|nr:hypothetical protein B0H11DRAFT_2249825 [Mycena galericulata]